MIGGCICNESSSHFFVNEISPSNSNFHICFMYGCIEVEVSFMFMVLCDDLRFFSL